MTEENRPKTYHSLVLKGKLRSSVRWITEHEKGGVLQPEEICTKTGERVMEVLRIRHPDALSLSASSLYTYLDQPLELVPLEITEDTVTELAGRISRGTGIGGTDSVIIQYWLQRFLAASRELRLAVADFVEWLGNG